MNIAMHIEEELPKPKRRTDCLLVSVAVVGRGERCKQIIKSIESARTNFVKLKLVAMVMTSEAPECRRQALENGIRIYDHINDLLAHPLPDILMEMTGDPELLIELAQKKPVELALIDRRASELLLNMLHWENEPSALATEIGVTASFASALLEASPDAVMVIDRNYRILNCNDSPLITGGSDREAVIGRHCFEVIHGDSQPCTDEGRPCTLAEAARTGRPARAVHEVNLPGGGTRITQVTTYPLVNHFGKIIQFVDIIRDITQDVSLRLEARTRVIKEDLARFVQEDRLLTLGRLVASVCHEINNPITSITTFNKLMLSYIQEDRLPEEGLSAFARYLDLSVREALRCGNIVNNLLTFARQRGVESKNFDLVELIHTILQLLHHPMDKVGVSLSLDLPAPPFEIYGDYAQIQQCLMNLITNAIEAMPDGGTLRIAAGTEENNRGVWLTVGDTGMGVAEADLQRIFEPFYSTKLDGKGVGLGLSMVYGIVREHGGSVTVDSQVGRGTTFRITLPSGPGPAAVAAGKGETP
jgi:two-component system NtrC family sensor kinase